MPGVVAHEEKIFAFDGRNPFDDEIIRGGLHSRRGIFCVPGVDIVELDVVRRPVVCPRLFVQPEHVTLVLSCGACGGQWSPGGRRMGSHSKHVCWAALSRSDWKT